MTSSARPAPPSGLSQASAGLWRTLAATHEFAVHEWVALEWALRLWDLSDRRLAEAGAVSDGRQSARLEKQGLDAATAALRHWRLLKFSDGEPARRPGRPSDREWSAIRGGRMPAQPGM